MTEQNNIKSTKCIECLVKRGAERSKIKVVLCKDCAKLDKYQVICTTKAKNTYFITDDDIDELDYMEGHTGYSYGFYYYVSEIKNIACRVHNTTLENLPNVLEHLQEEKTTRIAIRKANGIERRNNIKEKRKIKLINALNNMGLELRNDSKLCSKYIDGEIKDLQGVVKRMCQMKYLYDYCHMDECRDIAYEQYCDELNAGYFPDCSVSDQAEDIALRKYSNGKYPENWPWL
jgi:hypothetical protein